MARPSPVPCGLVLKNGLKIRSMSSRRNARAGVTHFHDDLRRLRIDRAHRLVLAGQQPGADVDVALAAERFEGVREQVREQLAQLVRVGQQLRHVRFDDRVDRHRAAPHLAFGQRDRILDHFVERRALDLQLNRPHELQHLDDDGVGHLGFFDDVVQRLERVLAVGHLALEHAGHDLDARERVLDLVRDGRGHLAERRQPVAQTLALFHLLDARQVLEEERRADHPAVVVVNVRERVAHRAAGLAQPHLGAVGEVVARRRPAAARAVTSGTSLQHFGERAADVARSGRQGEHPVGHVVHGRDAAVARDGEHAGAQVEDQVPEEAVAEQLLDPRGLHGAAAERAILTTDRLVPCAPRLRCLGRPTHAHVPLLRGCAFSKASLVPTSLARVTHENRACDCVSALRRID